MTIPIIGYIFRLEDGTDFGCFVLFTAVNIIFMMGMRMKSFL